MQNFISVVEYILYLLIKIRNPVEVGLACFFSLSEESTIPLSLGSLHPSEIPINKSKTIK